MYFLISKESKEEALKQASSSLKINKLLVKQLLIKD
ncbi:hypothetical protein QE357_002784 [Siphonobacter sp. BAB-5404]|nr:hypothetical protein [Siphonobacter sp. SORGH_AS_0500]